MSQRPSKKAAAPAVRKQQTPVSAPSKHGNKQASKPNQKNEKPKAPPKVDESSMLDDDEDDDAYSEPEEVDNDALLAEMRAEADEDDAEEEDEDEDEDDGEDIGDDEDDMDDDADDDDDVDLAAASSKKRARDASSSDSAHSASKKSKSFILPSSEEMSALRETEELFQSNLFKLALEELLKEISVDYSPEGAIRKIEPILHSLKQKIEAIESHEITYNPQAPAFGAPFPSVVSTSVAAATAASTSPSSAHSFTFHPPTAFHLVGSYPLHTGMREPTSIGTGRAALNIDVSVEIPAASLKQKDYWDYRYLAKRARFLQHIAEELHKQGGFEIRLGKMRGAVEKPVLLLYPQKQNADGTYATPSGLLGKMVIRVFANPPPQFFQAKRFHPSKANIHAVVAQGVKSEVKVKKEEKVDADGEGGAGAPSPYYNSLLSEDLFFTNHLAAVYELSQSPSMRETILLLKLWARQRRLDLARGDAHSENGGWGEFELAWTGGAAKAEKQQQSKKEKKKSVGGNSNARLELVSPNEYLFGSTAGASTGFNGFFFSMFLLHLVQTKQVYKAMSTYQLFKQVLQQILKMDLLAKGLDGQSKGGIVLGFDPAKSLHSLTLLTNPLAASTAAKEEETLQSWREARGFDLLFLDGEGTFNFASRISRSAYCELKQEAFLSLALLDDSTTLLSNIFGNGMLQENAASNAAAAITLAPATVALQTLLSTSKPLSSSASLGTDSFTALFVKPLQFEAKYDAYVRVQFGTVDTWLPTVKQFVSKSGESFLSQRVASVSAESDSLSLLLRSLEALLEQSLGDRILLSHLRPNFNASSGSLSVDIGLLLNPSQSSRVLDSGPSADEEDKASKFRDLWGDLASLRRFKDGSILEAVVWTTPDAPAGIPHAQPHLIPFQIIAYVLRRHLQIESDKVAVIFSQFDSLLKVRNIESQPTASQLQSGKEGHKNPLLLSIPQSDPLLHYASTLFSNFKGLSQALKSACEDEIPLQIISIRMTGEHARYTSPFPPTPIDILKLAPDQFSHAITDVVPVLVQFESSSKWPDDSLAISRIKSAFYIQFGSALSKRNIQSLVSLDKLDIFYHGFVFRLQIFYEQELNIRRIEEKMGQTALGSKMIPVPTSAQIQRNFLFFPLLSQQLKFVQETFALFAPSCRLVKRWIHAHMFSAFFPRPEVIELLVASLFTNPKPYSVPCSALQAFHRFLALIAHTDFVSTPIIVDLDGEMKTDVVDLIQAKFSQNRDAGTAPLIYIATNTDRECQLLIDRTADGKEKHLDQVVLDRLIQYARGSLGLLDGLLASSSSANSASAAMWKSAFKTPVAVPTAFDVLIHINPNAVPVQHMVKAIAPPSTVLASHQSNSSAKVEKGFKLPPDAAANQSLLKFSDNGASSSHSLPLVACNPVESFVASLRHLLGDVAYLYYDAYGGTCVGLKWKDAFRTQLAQASNTASKFSVKAAHYSKPIWEKKGSAISGVHLHVEQIIADIERAGRGLVAQVQRA